MTAAASRPIEVRRAERRDLPRVAELAAGLVRQHHATDSGRFFLPDEVERGYEAWLARELGRRAAVVLVAVRAEEVIGYAYGALEGRDWNALLDDHGVIHDVFVAEAARRAGAGRMLVDAMMQELEGLGAPRIVLYTMVQNAAAQALFTALGFRPTMLEMTRNA